jgi:hypothetical protein
MTTSDGLIDTSRAEITTRAPQLSMPSISERLTESREALRDDEVRISPQISNEPGEGVNRFLLCALVSKTARLVKARAERAGERLPMPAIIKSVLRSYQSAAKRSPGALAGSLLNPESLKKLLEDVMKEEIRRYGQEVVKTSQARLAQANKLGDEARIKTETEALERAVLSRKRLAAEFK